MTKNMYCGIGKLTKGKIRGTPEHCIRTNQVRYYGIESIDPDLIPQAKGQASDLLKEQLKLKRIEDDAKGLIKEAKLVKIILEDDSATKSQQKKAQKKMDELLIKRDKLVKKIKSQKDIVLALETEAKEKEEREKKKKTPSKKTSTKKKSSSKKN